MRVSAAHECGLILVNAPYATDTSIVLATRVIRVDGEQDDCSAASLLDGSLRRMGLNTRHAVLNEAHGHADSLLFCLRWCSPYDGGVLAAASNDRRKFHAARAVIGAWAARARPRRVVLTDSRSVDTRRTTDCHNTLRSVCGNDGFMLVARPARSAVSRRIAELSRYHGIPAYFIDTTSQIRPEWLSGKATIMFVVDDTTSFLVNDVLEALGGLAPLEVADLVGTTETAPEPDPCVMGNETATAFPAIRRPDDAP